jgi:hypothetical protein
VASTNHVAVVDAVDRFPVAYDMVKSNSHKLISYTNAWTNAFASSADGFQKYARGGANNASIPAVLLDETNAPGAPADTRGVIPYGDNDVFFGLADTINPQKTSGPVTAVWQFDIAGATDLALGVDVAVMGNFESTGSTAVDYFTWTVRVDNGAVQTVLAGAVDEALSRTYTMANDETKITLDDPFVVNGVKLDNKFQRFNVPITGTGSIATVTLEAVLDENDEAVAFRNLKILGAGPSCPASQCAGVTATVAPTITTSCSLTAVSLQKHLHTNGDVLVELFGPASSVDAADLVMSVPHGGNFKPTYMPDRSTTHPTYCPTSGCKTSADSNTKEIALLVQQKFIQNYCKVPYVVVVHLHRSKLDANRPVEEAAHGNAIAVAAWQAFHDYIVTAQNHVKTRFGTVTGSTGLVGVKGLLFDVHGYAGLDYDPVNGSPHVHWGVNLGMEDSLNTDIWCPIDDQSNGAMGTMTHARWLPGQSYECLVRGPRAIGSRLTTTGPGLCGASTPSYNHPSPLQLASECSTCAQMCGAVPTPCHYYEGGYDVEMHERIGWQNATGDYFNAIQAELPRCIRDGGTAVHTTFAGHVSIALMSFLRDLYGPMPV